MSTYLEVDRVKYMSSDDQWHPLCWLYFCRYCAELRSLDSLSHEVDSRFCPHCLDTMSNGGETVRKNRCGACYDCPSCGHTLSTRASNVAAPVVPAPDDGGDGKSAEAGTKSTSKKVYYLACGFCRWSSRDVGIPDQTVASGSWPEQENVHERRIGDLLTFYRALAAEEKLDEERLRRKSPRKRLAPQLLQDKYGLTSAVAKRRAGLLPSMSSLSLRGGPGEEKPPEIARPDAKSEVEPLPADIYTLPLNLSQVCTLSQRLAAPDVQPISRSQLHPLRKHLQVKRSLRCKKCDHNVFKPEYNAASIKFKICCAATNHVPEVRIKVLPGFSVGSASEVVITITNPVDRPLKCSLVPLGLPEDDDPTTSSVTLPPTEFTLAAKDEAGEYDVAGPNNPVADAFAASDAKEIVFRKANKLGLAVQVTPSKSALERGGRILTGFGLKYEYRNLTAVGLKSDQGREPETVALELPVLLDLGRLNESYA